MDIPEGMQPLPEDMEAAINKSMMPTRISKLTKRIKNRTKKEIAKIKYRDVIKKKNRKLNKVQKKSRKGNR